MCIGRKEIHNNKSQGRAGGWGMRQATEGNKNNGGRREGREVEKREGVCGSGGGTRWARGLAEVQARSGIRPRSGDGDDDDDEEDLGGRGRSENSGAERGT